MAYTPAAYKLGKGTTITIGSDTITNCRVIQLPQIEYAAVDTPHLGGLTADVGDVTSFGELVVELPCTQAVTSAYVLGTEYTITVTDSASGAILTSKTAKLRSINKGSVESNAPMIVTYTFKMTQAPY